MTLITVQASLSGYDGLGRHNMIQIGNSTAGRAVADDPIEHLVACHRRIETRLDTLLRAGRAWREQTSEANEAIANALAFMDTTARLHTADEELSLFPRLTGRVEGEEAELVGALTGEHVVADEALAKLKDLAGQLRSGNDVSDRFLELAGTIREMYREHIAREDEQLTSIARRALTPDDLAAVAVEMRARRQS